MSNAEKLGVTDALPVKPTMTEAIAPVIKNPAELVA